MSRSWPRHWHGGEPPVGRPVVVGVVPGQFVYSVAGRLAHTRRRPVTIVPAEREEHV